MKITSLIIFVLFLISMTCTAQNRFNILDSLESSFERVKRGIKIPCQFESKFNRRENGKPFFTINDSAQLEFDFIKVRSIPFFNSSDTTPRTINFYYDWLLRGQDTLKGIKLTIIDENKEYGYLVFQIEDASGKFYRVLKRNDDILVSIKIFGNKMSKEDQLDKLQTLYWLNKN